MVGARWFEIPILPSSSLRWLERNDETGIQAIHPEESMKI
jgi:hypothetical protein